MNNHIIPSTHAVREITNLSDKHSFTLHPSFSPYSQTELWRNEYTRFAWAGGTFFPVVLFVVSVFGSGGKKVLIYIRMHYLEYNTVVVVC